MSFKRILSIIVIISLCLSLLCGCNTLTSLFNPDGGGAVSTQKEGTKQYSSEDEKFDALCDEIFTEWITSDAITMNYFLAYPEEMGIERPEPTYGEVSTPELFEEGRAETAYYDAALSGISRDKLTGDRQVIYDILCRSIVLSTILEENDDYNYYTGYIKPLTGIQIQLPILLVEFSFYTQEDIEIYLELLADTIRYFDDIVEFERERARRGYFMTEANLDEVIEQLETFLEDREDTFLISVVNDKIDEFPGLTAEQREEYKRRNTQLVRENVLVAYDNLLEAMISLKGVGPAPGGLAALPDGERYAHAMLSSRAGTDRDPDELLALIGQWREETLARMRGYLFSDLDTWEKYQNDEMGMIPEATPEQYMAMLEDAVRQDFPKIEAINYTILEVHESLQEDMSPAFFLTPAIDCYDDNIIYVNPASFGDDPDDNLFLFTVLAHEGYPGHMYEAVFLMQKAPHPIRVMLSNTGHSEGWATYVECMSYSWAGLSETEAGFMRENRMYWMMLQSHVDIGVNLFNWDIDDVAQLLYDDLGVTDTEYVESIYNRVTGVPLNTSLYTFGYIEMMLLLEEAEAAWGDDFSLYAFHSYFLDFGPAPYELIRRGIES